MFVSGFLEGGGGGFVKSSLLLLLDNRKRKVEGTTKSRRREGNEDAVKDLQLLAATLEILGVIS